MPSLTPHWPTRSMRSRKGCPRCGRPLFVYGSLFDPDEKVFPHYFDKIGIPAGELVTHGTTNKIRHLHRVYILRAHMRDVLDADERLRVDLALQVVVEVVKLPVEETPVRPIDHDLDVGKGALLDCRHDHLREIVLVKHVMQLAVAVHGKNAFVGGLVDQAVAGRDVALVQNAEQRLVEWERDIICFNLFKVSKSAFDL